MFAIDAITIHRNSQDGVVRRAAIQSWLRANELCPDAIYSLRAVGRLARVREYELNADGEKFIRDGQPAMRTRWVWLTYRPPEFEAVA